jgi:uncharacterized protein
MFSPRVAELLLFLPSRADPGPAPRLAGVQGEDLVLTASDGVRIHGWWFEAGADAPAVLFLHGNAGSIRDRTFQAEGMLHEGISILLLSYRGYGRSEGRPGEEGVRRDAEAGLDWLLARTGGGDRVVVHGRSLGAAVAGMLLRRRPDAAGLVVESAFTDLHGIARAVYPIFPSILLRRLRGRYDTRTGVAGSPVPVLVVHGSRDEIVPVEMGRELARVGPPGTRYLEVPGARHNDLPFVAGSAYFRQVAEFVREVTRVTGASSPPRPP